MASTYNGDIRPCYLGSDCGMFGVLWLEGCFIRNEHKNVDKHHSEERTIWLGALWVDFVYMYIWG